MPNKPKTSLYEYTVDINDDYEVDVTAANEEEAALKAHKAYSVMLTHDNLDMVNKRLADPSKNPNFAVDFAEAASKASKLQALQQNNEGWKKLGIDDPKNMGARIQVLDAQLKKHGFKTISELRDEQLKAEDERAMAKARRANPDATIIRDAKGNYVPVKTTGVSSANSDAVMKRKALYDQWRKIDINSNPFSPAYKNVIKAFVDNRTVVASDRERQALLMASELRKEHPSWSQEHTLDAVKFYMAQDPKKRWAGATNAGGQLAMKYNKIDTKFDSDGTHDAERTKKAIRSGIGGAVIGAARNITFGLGEERTMLWLEKIGYKPDEGSALIAQIGTAPLAIVVGARAQSAVLSSVGAAAKASRFGTALQRYDLAYRSTQKLADGAGVTAKLLQAQEGIKANSVATKLVGGAIKSFRGLRNASSAASGIMDTAGTAGKVGAKRAWNITKGILATPTGMPAAVNAGEEIVKQYLSGFEAKPEDMNFINRQKAERERGILQGELGTYFDIALNDKDHDIRKLAMRKVAQHQTAISKIADNPEFLKWSTTNDWKELFGNPLKAAENLTLLMQSSLGVMHKTIATNAFAAGIGGTGIGSIPARLIAGSASFGNTKSVEYGTTMIKLLQESGVDITNPEQVLAFTRDKARMDIAKKKANARGNAVAALDFLGSAIGGLAYNHLAKTMGEKAVANLGVTSIGFRNSAAARLLDVFVGASIGAGGELFGQMAEQGKIVGADINYADVRNEFIGDAKSIVDSVYGSWMETNDGVMAWNKAFSDASAVEKYEVYKASARHAAINSDDPDSVARHKAMRRMVEEEGKKSGGKIVVDEGNEVDVTTEALDKLEQEYKSLWDIEQMSFEDRSAVIRTISSMQLLGVPVEAYQIDYWVRAVNSLNDEQKAELGLNDVDEQGTSRFDKEIAESVARVKELSDPSTENSVYVEMVGQLNRNGMLSTGFDTNGAEIALLLEEGDRIEKLKMSEQNPVVMDTYATDLDVINAELLKQGNDRVYQTELVKRTSEQYIPQLFSLAFDGKDTGRGTFKVGDIKIAGTFNVTDAGVFFEPDKPDLLGGTDLVPVDLHNLPDFTVEETQQQEQLVEEVEEPYIPVAERFVAKPKEPVEQTVHTKSADLQTQLEDMEAHAPKEPKAPNRKALQSEVKRYRRLKTAYDAWVVKHDALVAEVETAKQLSELTRQLEELDNSKPETPSKSKGETVYQRQLKEYNAWRAKRTSLMADIAKLKPSTAPENVPTKNPSVSEAPAPMQEPVAQPAHVAEEAVAEPAENDEKLKQQANAIAEMIGNPIQTPSEIDYSNLPQVKDVSNGRVIDNSVGSMPIYTHTTDNGLYEYGEVTTDGGRVFIYREISSDPRRENVNAVFIPEGTAFNPSSIHHIQQAFSPVRFSIMRGDKDYVGTSVSRSNNISTVIYKSKYVVSEGMISDLQKLIPAPTKPVETPAIAEDVNPSVRLNENNSFVLYHGTKSANEITSFDPNMSSDNAILAWFSTTKEYADMYGEKKTYAVYLDKNANILDLRSVTQHGKTYGSEKVRTVQEWVEILSKKGVDGLVIKEGYAEGETPLWSLLHDGGVDFTDATNLADILIGSDFDAIRWYESDGMRGVDTVGLIKGRDSLYSIKQDTVNTAPAQETPQVKPFSFAIGTQMNAQVETTDSGVSVTVSDRTDGRKRKTFKFASIEEMASKLPDIISDRQAETATIDVSDIPASMTLLRDAVTAHNARAEQAREAMKQSQDTTPDSEALTEDDNALLESIGVTEDILKLQRVEPPSVTVAPTSDVARDIAGRLVESYALENVVEAGHAQYIKDMALLRSLGDTSSPEAVEAAKRVLEHLKDTARMTSLAEARDKMLHATMLYAVKKAGSTKTNRNGMFELEDAQNIVAELKAIYGNTVAFDVNKTIYGTYEITMNGKPVAKQMFVRGNKNTVYDTQSTLHMEFIEGTEALLKINLENVPEERRKQFLEEMGITVDDNMPVITAQQIIQVFSERAGLFTYTNGDLKGTGFLGLAHLLNRTIEIETEQDLEGFIHEFGHHNLSGKELAFAQTFLEEYAKGSGSLVDADIPAGMSILQAVHYLATAQKVVKEGTEVSIYPEDYSEQEGLAELFRMFVIDPVALSERLPLAHAVFNKTMPDALREVAQDMRAQAYIMSLLSPLQIAKSQTVTEAGVNFAERFQKIMGLKASIFGQGYKSTPVDFLAYGLIDQWYPALKTFMMALERKDGMTKAEIDKQVGILNAWIGQFEGAGGITEAMMRDMSHELGLKEPGDGSSIETSTGHTIGYADILQALKINGQVSHDDIETLNTYLGAATHVEDAEKMLKELEYFVQQAAIDVAGKNKKKSVPVAIATIPTSNQEGEAEFLNGEMQVDDEASSKQMKRVLQAIAAIQNENVDATIVEKFLNTINRDRNADAGFDFTDKTAGEGFEADLKKMLLGIHEWVRNGMPYNISVSYGTKEKVENSRSYNHIVNASSMYNRVARAVVYKHYIDGLIDFDTYMGMTHARKHYGDIHRVMNSLQAVGSDYDTMFKFMGINTGTRGAGDITKGRKGSKKMIHDPLMNLAKQIATANKAGAMNKILSTFGEVFLSESEYGSDKLGGKPSGSFGHQMTNFKATDVEKMTSNRVFSYMKNGQPVFIKVENDLAYKSILQLTDFKSINGLSQIVAFQRRLITTSPSFILRNAIRDRFGVMRKAKNIGATPFSKSWWKLWTALPNASTVMRQRARGTTGGTLAVHNPKSFVETQNQVIHDVNMSGLKGFRKVWYATKSDFTLGGAPDGSKRSWPNPVALFTSYYKWMETLAEATEMAPRIVEYEEAYKRYSKDEEVQLAKEVDRLGLDMDVINSSDQSDEARMQRRAYQRLTDRAKALTNALANRDARELQDFSRAGTLMPILNSLAGPFLAGKVSGTAADLRAWKRSPRSFFRSLSMQLIQTLISGLGAWYWYDDEDRRSKYEGFSDNIKDLFLLYPFNNDTVLSVPLGFSDAIQASLGRRIVECHFKGLDAAKQDKPYDFWKEVAINAGEVLVKAGAAEFPLTSENIGGPLTVLFGMASNYDPYLKRNIVPEMETSRDVYVKTKATGEQKVLNRISAAGASRFAFGIADKLKMNNLDPRQVDFAVREIFGTAGRDITRFMDVGYGSSGRLRGWITTVNQMIDGINSTKSEGEEKIKRVSPLPVFEKKLSVGPKETWASATMKMTGLITKQPVYFDDVVLQNLVEAKRYKNVSQSDTDIIQTLLGAAAIERDEKKATYFVKMARKMSEALKNSAKAAPSIPAFGM